MQLLTTDKDFEQIASLVSNQVAKGEFMIVKRAVCSLVLAGALLLDVCIAISQPDVSNLQLRLLNEQQALQLQQRQQNYRNGLGDLTPEKSERLRRNLDRQRHDQRQLQERHGRRLQALRQQIRVTPEPRAAAKLSLQRQEFTRRQRQQQLNHAIQRRSWSPLIR